MPISKGTTVFATRSADRRSKGAFVPPKFWAAIIEPMSKTCHELEKPIFYSVWQLPSTKLFFWLRACLQLILQPQ